MSMNLHAKCSTGTIDLWQTPTKVTSMILVDSSGPVCKLKGKKARRALYAYIAWVMDAGTVVIATTEESKAYEEDFVRRREHAEYVEGFLNESSLEVYAL